MGFALRSGVAAFRVMNHRELPPFLRSCGVPDAKIRFLSALYLDLETFRPDGAVPKVWDVAFVARMVPNKGAPVLLEALAAILGSAPGCAPVSLGKGRCDPRSSRAPASSASPRP